MHKKAWNSLGMVLLGAIMLHACGTRPATPVEHKSNPPLVDPAVVQSLQRQIRERDKRIEELEFQLDTLKLIDQDVEKQKKSVRPPATLTPFK
jgi:hypothetical protein